MPKVSEMRRQQTMDCIIQAASEIFSRNGYHNTQIMDIVRSAGISAGTFYNYFKDKRDIFDQITQGNSESIRLHLKELRSSFNIWDRNERIKILRVTYTVLFDYIDASPHIFLMMLRGGYGVDEAFDQVTWGAFSTWASDFGEDVEKWIEEGFLEGIKPVLISHAVLGMGMQIVHSYIVEKKYSREEAIEGLIKMSLGMVEAFLTEKGKDLLMSQPLSSEDQTTSG
jgi:AcrR family transcriptional regulator